MKKVALIIPTLCRYEHFVNCVESLKKNTYACEFDLYIALDYPSKDTHWDGYNKIAAYLSANNFDCFNKKNVVKRTHNYGAYKNEVNMLEDYIFPYYDMWCRTDDDVVFSENYLEYMYKNLEKYEKDENIMAVSGYSYPCNYVVSDGASVFFQNYHVPMWGTGFWKKKFLEMRSRIVDDICIHRNFDYYIRDKSYKNLIDARYIDFVDAGLSWQSDKLVYLMSDVAITIYCGLHNKCVAYPVISKAKNNGFDGSGMTCQILKEDTEIYRINVQKIDDKKTYKIVEDEMESNENYQIINTFDSRSKVSLYKSKLKLLLYFLLGKKRYRRLWMKCNPQSEQLIGE